LSKVLGFPSATSVRVTWGDSDLTADSSCSAILKNAGGGTLDTVTPTDGFSTRSAGFDSLTTETDYSVLVTCVGYEDSTFAFTTLEALTGTATYSVALEPNAIISTASKAKVDYRIPGGGTSSVTDESCGSGCTVDLTLNRGALYEIRHQWLTSGDAVLTTSDWRNVTIQ